MLFSTELPSQTLPYRVKVVEVDLFKPKQIALMSKSVMLDDIQPALDAMHSVLRGIDIDELTVGDFYYLLTWQRFHCFKSNPVIATWECPGTMFSDINTNDKYTPSDVSTFVSNWEAADDAARLLMRDPNTIELDAYICQHGNMETLTFEDFSVLSLDPNTVLDQRLDYPRCNTLSEFIRLQSDPDYGMIADAAQWIKGPANLRERINKLLETEDTELMEVACAANRDVRHGILRSVVKPCRVCSHKHGLNFTVEPRSFFL
jgi:hypothetical protein